MIASAIAATGLGVVFAILGLSMSVNGLRRELKGIREALEKRDA